MDKRGQFYLIAAIIIIGIVLTSVTAVNYVKTKKQKYPIYSIGDIVNFETAQVLDNGIVNNVDLDDRMLEWITAYSEYGSKSVSGDWLFIYGTKDSSGATTLNALIINQSTSGTVGFDGTMSIEIIDPHTVRIRGLPTTVNPSTGKVDVTVFDKIYSFDVKEGQNFYFVITAGGQTASSQP